MGFTNAMSSVGSIASSPADANIHHSVGFPDPFAVATVGGEQTHTTSVIKKTLNPYWNEIFDLYGLAGLPMTLTLMIWQEGQ